MRMVTCGHGLRGDLTGQSYMPDKQNAYMLETRP